MGIPGVPWIGSSYFVLQGNPVVCSYTGQRVNLQIAAQKAGKARLTYQVGFRFVVFGVNRVPCTRAGAGLTTVELYMGAHPRLVQKCYVPACAAEQKLQLQLPVSHGAFSTVV